MRIALTLCLIIALSGCGKVSVIVGESITDEQLKKVFRKHKNDENHAVALNKQSIADSYLATIHGYPDNLSVCQDLIQPYNNNTEISDVAGKYYCEELT